MKNPSCLKKRVGLVCVLVYVSSGYRSWEWFTTQQKIIYWQAPEGHSKACDLMSSSCWEYIYMSIQQHGGKTRQGSAFKCLLKNRSIIVKLRETLGASPPLQVKGQRLDRAVCTLKGGVGSSSRGVQSEVIFFRTTALLFCVPSFRLWSRLIHLNSESV